MTPGPKRDRGHSDDPPLRRMLRGKAGSYRDELSPEDAAFLTRVMERADLPMLERYLAS